MMRQREPEPASLEYAPRRIQELDNSDGRSDSLSDQLDDVEDETHF